MNSTQLKFTLSFILLTFFWPTLSSKARNCRPIFIFFFNFSPYIQLAPKFVLNFHLSLFQFYSWLFLKTIIFKHSYGYPWPDLGGKYRSNSSSIFCFKISLLSISPLLVSNLVFSLCLPRFLLRSYGKPYWWDDPAFLFNPILLGSHATLS